KYTRIGTRHDMAANVSGQIINFQDQHTLVIFSIIYSLLIID
ncbi:MAG: hypothetical protein ACI9RV_002448, partial [Glaciecola sp.]